MSDKALHIVQHAAQEDKDFVASMEEYRNVIPGTKDTGKTRSVSHKPPQVEGPKELDGGYFALIGNMSKLSLLQQVSTLEEENAALTLALNETKEDVVVYAEVAREMEITYDTMMAIENATYQMRMPSRENRRPMKDVSKYFSKTPRSRRRQYK